MKQTKISQLSVAVLFDCAKTDNCTKNFELLQSASLKLVHLALWALLLKRAEPCSNAELRMTDPDRFQRFAATTVTSKSRLGVANLASTVVRAGAAPTDTQASHTAFMAAKSSMLLI